MASLLMIEDRLHLGCDSAIYEVRDLKKKKAYLVSLPKI